MKQQYSKLKLLLGKGLFMMVVLIGINQYLFGQNINFGDCPYMDILPLDNQMMGDPVNISISADDAGDGFTMSIVDITSSTGGGICNPCSNTVYKGFDFSVVGDNVEITSTGLTDPSLLGEIITFQLMATRDSGSPLTCTRTYTFEVIRKPMDLYFVLDISGSMSGRVDPTCIGGGCKTKIQELKEAVGLFFDRGLAAGNFNEDDRAAVVYFETAVDNTDTTLVSWESGNIDPLKLKVGAKTLGNLTNMNGGLGAATPATVPSGRNKFIILFTDGMQNVSPLITSTAGANPTVAIGGSNFNADISTTKIYTIGLNAPSGAVYALLGDIAHATNGIAYYNTTPEGDPDLTFALNESFMNSFISILKGSSPQIIDYRYKNATGKDEISERFAANKGASKLILEYYASGSMNSDASIRVLKDSVDVTQYGSVTYGNGYRIFSIDLPTALSYEDTIHSEGEWDLIIRNSFGPYQVSAIIDDHRLQYDCSIGDKVYSVGDTLELNVALSLDGKPLTDANQVTALVFPPGDDWGHSLATTPSPRIDTTSVTDPGTPGQSKGLALLSDSAYYNNLLPSSQVITLANNNDGTYSGSFEDTELSGPYRIVFLIKGNSAEIGNYERRETLSTMFNFGQLDPDNSVQSHSWDNDTLSIDFAPVNKFGNLLGPDYDTRITINPEPDEVVDNLDGSYTYIFYNTPQSSDPQLTITINGEEFYNGEASSFGDKPCDQFYCHWWFWVLLLIFIIIILLIIRKNKNP